MNKKVEILAPAGNMDCLNAAVCAGADAVYLGLDQFNARRGADNFTIETLKAACDYAHLRGVKIYLTFNIIVFENEFERAINLVISAANAGVDAFIVQDIGVAKALAKYIPNVPIHISTQMNIHDEAGLRFVASLGAKRVTLARELSIDGIKAICDVANELGIEIETFAHGAICICYSGQCLMSSMIGGRSANRGTCAQACRLNYELKNGKWDLGKRQAEQDDKRGKYLLSPKDLCTIEILPELIEAGVSSLKIEGRMKSADYVFSVVKTYKAALDRIQNSATQNYKVDEGEIKTLQEVFSRGFSPAYMKGRRGNDIMSYNRPNNRGINIGRVLRVSASLILIDTKEQIYEGDVFEVWTKKGRSTLIVDNKASIMDGQVLFKLDKDNKTYRCINVNDRVFRVSCNQHKFSPNMFDPRLPIKCKVELKIGSPMHIEFVRGNCKVQLDGDVVETARTKAITVDEVIQHIDRLGQTPFMLESIDVELDNNVGLSFSQLHNLRSECLVLLQKHILTNFKESSDGISKVVLKQNKSNRKNEKLQVCAIATNPESARAAKRSGAGRIYVPFYNYKLGGATYEGKASTEVSQTTYPKDSVIMQPTVYAVAKGDIKLQFCDSLSAVYFALQNGINFEVGPHVPIVNNESCKYFSALGVSRIWLSPELSIEQIKDITQSVNNVSFGLYVSGATELMISKHCHLMSEGECSQNCSSCKRRQGFHYLLDRKGYEFPAITDATGTSHIYNSVLHDVCHAIPELLDAGIDSFMVDSTLLSVEETAQAVGRAVRALSTQVDRPNNTTSGHLFKPVL